MASEFEAKSPANQLLLCHKFASCMMQSDVSLTQHLHAFDALLLKLKAGRLTISDQEAVLQLFMSLPTEYETVSTALAVQPELSYTKCKIALATEELKMKARSRVGANKSHGVLVAKREGGRAKLPPLPPPCINNKYKDKKKKDKKELPSGQMMMATAVTATSDMLATSAGISTRKRKRSPGM